MGLHNYAQKRFMIGFPPSEARTGQNSKLSHPKSQLNGTNPYANKFPNIYSMDNEISTIYWNSGNFYSIAASNSLKHISTFINLLPKAAIPMEYVYEKLPRNISW